MYIDALDWTVVVFYIISLIVVGLVASRSVKGTDQYFLGKRHFGKLLMIAQSFGVGTHADMPVSLTGAVYSSGISAIWFQWKNLFAMPFYWIIAPVFRRVRRTTTAEMMGDRYGDGMASLYVVFSFAFFIINIATTLKGAAKILSMIFDGLIGVDHIVMVLAGIFILYSFIGGLTASTWSDFIQGILIIMLSFMLIPPGWHLVGGLEGLRENLPPMNLSISTPKEIGLWFIFMLTINGIIGIMAQPHMMASVGTGKNEYACRTGLLYGNFIKRICTVGWAFIGLITVVLVKRGIFGVKTLGDAEEAFGFACRHLLGHGLRGLLIASVMGAGMACCSALMIDSGALFTQSVYRRIASKEYRDVHYLWVGRWSGLVVVIIAVVYAVFFVNKVLYSFLLTETLATYIGISVVTGIIWERANRWGAVTSLIASLSTNFLVYYVRHERLDNWDPNVFLASILVGFITLIVVSLATRPEPHHQTALFFSQLVTPSDLTEEEGMARSYVPSGVASGIRATYASAPYLNKWDAENGRQLLIVNLFHLRQGACGVGIFRAYKHDLIGLLIGFVLCVGLVVALWTLLHL